MADNNITDKYLVLFTYSGGVFPMALFQVTFIPLLL